MPRRADDDGDFKSGGRYRADRVALAHALGPAGTRGLKVKLDNIWRGLCLTHPVQLHLNALPHDLIVEIITDFARHHDATLRPNNNYEDWLVASYGRKFADLIPMQYGRKYHTTTASNMSTDWRGPRMYRPSPEELPRGALAPWNPEVHYIAHLRYPRKGGLLSHLNKFPSMADIRLGHEAVAVNPRARTVRCAGGKTTTYGALVSSVPLPDLILMVAGVPQDVVDASRRLACTTCVLVNVGVDRANLSEGRITYVYDEDLVFSRRSFPHMLSKHNAPAGCGRVQAEVHFSSKHKPHRAKRTDRLDGNCRPEEGERREGQGSYPHAVRQRRALRQFGLSPRTRRGDHDGSRLPRRRRHPLCGGYGEWGYMWTDEGFISVERAAKSALSAALV